MKDKKTKKILVFAGTIFLGLVLIFFLVVKKGKDESGPALPQKSEQEIAYEQMILDKEKEPEIKLSLDSSLSRGALLVSKIDPAFSALEYELIYVSEYQGSLIERGVSSGGSIAIPENRSLSKDLVFGVESCSIDRCHFTAEKVEPDQPGTLILRLLDEENRVWELEKKITFKKEGAGYTGILE